jgi:hypothetical protein
MNRIFITLFLLLFPGIAHSQASISPSLYFARQNVPGGFTAKATVSPNTAPVTFRFDAPPAPSLLDELESLGVRFARSGGVVLHSERIYPATIDLDNLDALAQIPGIVRIEHSYRPSAPPTLDVSNPQVQASRVWFSSPPLVYDGTGVTIANIDVGVDIYHPALFKADGGAYSWIDVNLNGQFDSGIDCVDLNGNGRADIGEILRFFDAPCQDSYGLIDRTDRVYDADLDWLYNDANGNGVRDYGPAAGFNETSPCYGERLFIIDDVNRSNRLNPGETLIGLGTSKIRVIYDKGGRHERGIDLLANTGDIINHGTASIGILGGQQPGRRFAGMAPGAEFVCINRTEVTNEEEAILNAKADGARLFMYEYGSWVYEFLDGSSNSETLIDDLYHQGLHQFTASGNLAGPTRKRHAFVTIQNTALPTISFTIPNIGITEIYLSLLWSGSTLTAPKPSFKLKLPDATLAPFYNDNRQRKYGQITVTSGHDYSPRGTHRTDVLVSSATAFSGTFTITVAYTAKTSIPLHLYLADSVTEWLNGAQFTDYDTDDGTVCSPGTALSGVTVGAYDPRGTRNQKGNINDFSGRGKTVDGRMGVKITAPGTLVFSLASHFPQNTVPGGYLEFGGTSAALPHVCGCAALLEQAMPGISPDSLAASLYEHAAHDAFTGAVPNDIWGYGKLRIFDTFSGLHLLPVGVKNQAPSVFTVSEGAPNPFNSRVSFIVSPPRPGSSPLVIDIYNVLGQHVARRVIAQPPDGRFTVTFDSEKEDFQHSSSGLLFVSFTSGGNRVTKKILMLK